MRNLITCLIIFLATNCFSQKKYNNILTSLDSDLKKYEKIAQDIWSFAEMGYQEENSSNLLQKTLNDEGFKVSKGVAGIPTAFVELATIENGQVVISLPCELAINNGFIVLWRTNPQSQLEGTQARALAY